MQYQDHESGQGSHMEWQPNKSGYPLGRRLPDGATSSENLDPIISYPDSQNPAFTHSDQQHLLQLDHQQAQSHSHHPYRYYASQQPSPLDMTNLSVTSPTNLSPSNTYSPTSLHSMNAPNLSGPSLRLRSDQYSASSAAPVQGAPQNRRTERPSSMQQLQMNLNHLPSSPSLAGSSSSTILHAAQALNPSGRYQYLVSPINEDQSMGQPQRSAYPEMRAKPVSMRRTLTEDLGPSDRQNVLRKRSFTADHASPSIPNSPVNNTTEKFFDSSSTSISDPQVRANRYGPPFQIMDDGGGDASPNEVHPLQLSDLMQVVEDDELYGLVEDSETLPTAKPSGANNFVIKLYAMLSDVKSSQYIAWTEKGNSFLVSGVGEFSRQILGSHFKHNNFSSFVRQLNMYGFHKINRTPRSASRGNIDAQAWEFMHPSFKRDQPELLEDVKRKTPEDNAKMNGRIAMLCDLPTDIQSVKDENKILKLNLTRTKERLEDLMTAFKILWGAVEQGVPGALQMEFPKSLLEPLQYAEAQPLSTSPVNTVPFRRRGESSRIQGQTRTQAPKQAPSAGRIPDDAGLVDDMDDVESSNPQPSRKHRRKRTKADDDHSNEEESESTSEILPIRNTRRARPAGRE